jgi:hypothetical protein
VLGVSEGVGDKSGGIVKLEGDKVTVHVGLEGGSADEMIEAEAVRTRVTREDRRSVCCSWKGEISTIRNDELNVRCKFGFLDKLEVVVGRDASSLVILHLLSDVVQERAPLRGRTELRNVVVGHVNSLVGNHDHAGAGKMVEVVEVSGRKERGEVGGGLQERRAKERISFSSMDNHSTLAGQVKG